MGPTRETIVYAKASNAGALIKERITDSDLYITNGVPASEFKNRNLKQKPA